MYPFHYKVSLKLGHPTIDPQTITDALNTKPTFSWMMGEGKKTPVGERLKGFNKSSYWLANICGDELRDSELNELVDLLFDLVGKLKPAKEFLRSFAESGGEIRILLGLFCPQNSGIVIPWELLSQLAALRTGIDLDYYPGEPEGTS